MGNLKTKKKLCIFYKIEQLFKYSFTMPSQKYVYIQSIVQIFIFVKMKYLYKFVFIKTKKGITITIILFKRSKYYIM